MSITPSLTSVASTQQQTGYWTEVSINPNGRYLHLSNNERGINSVVTVTTESIDAHILFSVKGCANINTYEPANNAQSISSRLTQLFKDAEPSDEPFVLVGYALEEMTDFTEGYGLTKPASVLMGERLINSMVNHITKESLYEDSARIVRKDFNGIDKLSCTEKTTQFFSANHRLIKRWLKRQASSEKRKTSNTVAYANTHLPLLSDKGFSSKDIKAVLVDNNTENPNYATIADAITKTTALALADNYKNFSAYWIPF